jgi:Integrase zinc binding domain
MGHTGYQRVYDAISMYFGHNKLSETVKEYTKKCDACQQCKIARVDYSELPPRIANNVPWSDVAIDLIGPWKFRDVRGFEHSFRALTIIDMVTNYVEIIRLNNKTAEHVAMQFENNWIA